MSFKGNKTILFLYMFLIILLVIHHSNELNINLHKKYKIINSLRSLDTTPESTTISDTTPESTTTSDTTPDSTITTVQTTIPTTTITTVQTTIPTTIDSSSNSSYIPNYYRKSSGGISTGGILAIILPCLAALIAAGTLAFICRGTPPVETVYPVNYMDTSLERFRPPYQQVIVQQPVVPVVQDNVIQQPPVAIVGQPGVVVGQPGVVVGQPGVVVEQPGALVEPTGVIVEQPGAVVEPPVAVVVEQP
jgi:hypothetical protein